MIEQDTIKLLRECDAGVQMGIASIDEILDDVQSDGLESLLTTCKNEHVELANEIQSLLSEYHDDGKAPNPMAKGMSWLKTNVKLAVEKSDHMIADLMMDGCDMGVKSLSRYLNQYAAADEQSKKICKDLIKLEDHLSEDLRDYL